MAASGSRRVYVEHGVASRRRQTRGSRGLVPQIPRHTEIEKQKARETRYTHNINPHSNKFRRQLKSYLSLFRTPLKYYNFLPATTYE